MSSSSEPVTGSSKMDSFCKWIFCALSLCLGIWISSSSEGAVKSEWNASASSNVPALSLLNECMKFLRWHLRRSHIALVSIDEIGLESFGEDVFYQKTVYLRSQHSFDPIPAVHRETEHIVNLNVTSLELTIIDYGDDHQSKGPWTVSVDLAQTAQNRWALISFLSSSHLPRIQEIQSFDVKKVGKIKVFLIVLTFNEFLQKQEILSF